MEKMDYQEEFGIIDFEDGFEQKLSGHTVDEQMEHYRIKMVTTIEKYSYGELDSERSWEKIYKLEDCDDVKGLVMKEEIIVGVMLRNCWKKNKVCFPNQSVCVYFSSDDDGVGGSSRTDVAYLICV